MATPVLRKHTLQGALGEILVDVRGPSSSTGVPAVVIVHGFKGFKDWGMFPVFADRLARAGFSAVSYNASGSGVDEQGEFSRPERFAQDTFSTALHDLETVATAALDGTLISPTPSSLGVVGHSRGGGIALLFASRGNTVAALVTWSSISTVHRWSEETRRRCRTDGYIEVQNKRTGQVLRVSSAVLDDLEAHAAEYDLEERAADLTIPWLILHGDADETVPVAEGKLLAASAPRAELHLIEDAGHTFGASHPLETHPPSLVEVFDRSVAFLARHLA